MRCQAAVAIGEQAMAELVLARVRLTRRALSIAWAVAASPGQSAPPLHDVPSVRT